MRRLVTLLLLVIFAGHAMANAPNSSLRPKPRKSAEPEVRQVLVPVGYRPTIRPKPRPFSVSETPIPDDGALGEGERPEVMIIVVSATGVSTSLRPRLRPRDLAKRFARASASANTAAATPRKVTKPVVIGKGGAMCGDRSIQGVKVSSISGRLKGCGVSNPVKISAVDGVVLSQPSIMDCTTAKALKTWVSKGAKPAVGRYGGGLKSLKIVAHYSCRTRNSQKGARISEHGKGKAIDIAALRTNDGTTITLLQGWRHARHGPMLKKMHKAACGPFGTVLGPNSNKFHQDHFHFDTARYRGGPYCK